MPAEPDQSPQGTGQPARMRRAASRAARGAVILVPVVLAACQPAVLDPAGPVGLAQKQILIGSVVIMLAIVVPTIAATLAFAWWFRAGNPRAQRLPDWAYSGRLELVTWAIPLLTIVLLGGVAWIGSHDLDPAKPLASDKAPLEVQVVSLDWKWLFIYPGQRIASVNQLVIPAGVPVRFSLTSASVMNAFFVPQLGSMIYTMNGMATQLNLQADQPGTFRGLSAHYSGDGFSDMHFEVQALDGAGFAAWVDAARKDGPALDTASYPGLAQQSIKASPSTFRDAEPGLFDKIVAQSLPPGPGPENQPGQSTSSQSTSSQSTSSQSALNAPAGAPASARHQMEH